MDGLPQDCRARKENVPFCSHGPCILFKRKKKNKTVSFYACSACRSRKECPFYLESTKPVDSAKYKHYVRQQRRKADAFRRGELEKLKAYRKCAPFDRHFCKRCGCTFISEELDVHRDHEVISPISDDQMYHPSSLLCRMSNKRALAQQWFSDHSLKFLTDMIRSLKFDSVLCIGTPTLFEHLHERADTRCFLMDIDERFYQFWGPKSFARYNMFVHYFYTGVGKTRFKRFVDGSQRLLIVVDPPFGGLIRQLANSLKKISALFSQRPNDECHFALISPYFMEKKVVKTLPNAVMLEMQIAYTTKPYNSGYSPIRIFTDLPASFVKLPRGEGYRYCKECKRHVSRLNRHCDICNACTSKNGKPYSHCFKCERCVKVSFKHCENCGFCHLRKTPCDPKEIVAKIPRIV